MEIERCTRWNFYLSSTRYLTLILFSRKGDWSWDDSWQCSISSADCEKDRRAYWLRNWNGTRRARRERNSNLELCYFYGRKIQHWIVKRQDRKGFHLTNLLNILEYEFQDKINEEIGSSLREIYNLKGYTNWSIGFAVAEIVEAICSVSGSNWVSRKEQIICSIPAHQWYQLINDSNQRSVTGSICRIELDRIWSIQSRIADGIRLNSRRVIVMAKMRSIGWQW